MVNYWRYQKTLDVLFAGIVAVMAVVTPEIGFPVVFTLSSSSVILAARSWVGPALTLLGMMSATTAFIFSVIERGEFSNLRNSGAEAQLWIIFSQNLFWLTCGAIMCTLLSFLRVMYLTNITIIVVLFVFTMVCLSICKFTWLMRQIISVRIVKGSSARMR